MKRRSMLSTAGGVAVVIALPAFAQTQRVKRIGYMTALPPDHPFQTQMNKEFADNMKRLGWSIGRDLLVDYRYGGSDPESHFANARALIESGVDLIIAPGDLQTAAALRATRTVPILMAAIAPVEAGFAKSLARPGGGNATGMALVSLESQVKPLAMLREIRPGLTKLGLPISSQEVAVNPFWSLMQSAGRILGISIVALPDIRDMADLDGMLTAARREGIQAIGIRTRLFLLGAGGQRIRAWAIENSVLTWSGTWLKSDVLLAHTSNLAKVRTSSSRQIDLILRGANPAEIPIEEPTEYDVVIHKGIAKAMGLTLPTSVLLQATEVID